MSAVTRPRGPLPARVYWTRRLLVLGTAFVLVFGLARVLGGGSDGRSDDTGGQAAAVAGTPTGSSFGPTPSATRSQRPAQAKQTKQTRRPKKTPLAQPSGPCAPSDVVVRPTVDRVEGGTRVTIPLELESIAAEACTFTVSASSIAVKLVSGKDFIWSSQDCPRGIPRADVVVRRSVPVTVDVSWSGRRSDDDCSTTTLWAEPGYYHAIAATFGGEPVDTQFELTRRGTVTVTKTVEPEPQQPKASKPTDQPTGEKSGATEPNG